MSMARADLRKLRNKISAKISCRQNTQASLGKYLSQSQTDDFIDRYESELTVEETETLRKRVDIARNAAKAAPPKVKFRKLPRKLKAPKLKVEVKLHDSKPCRDLSGRTSQQLKLLMIAGRNQEMLLWTVSVMKFQLAVFTILRISLMKLIFFSLMSLMTWTRLTRLQFFSQTWAQNSGIPSSSLTPIGVPAVLDNAEKDSNACEIVPVESSEQDRRAFNDWYYAKVDQKFQSC